MTSTADTPKAQLEKLLASIPPNTPEHYDERQDLLNGARKLMIALERPDNVIHRVGYGVWDLISVRVAMNMGIFQLLEQKSPRSADEIINETKGEPVLIGRVLRALAAHHSLETDKDGKYHATSTSSALSTPENEVSMTILYDFMLPGWIKTPEFLRATDYQNPESGTKTIIALGYGKPEGATVWDILSATPHVPSFSKYMTIYGADRRSWMDVYPVQERLGHDAKTDPDAVLMVDCGGAMGHQAIAFKQRFGHLPGRVVVEDLPHVVANAKSTEVEYVAHDLTTAQPIKGARFYYFRWIMHDWPQSTCTQMLAHIRAAMTPGYSKVLVNEWIISEVGATQFKTAADLNMMTIGGMERTLAMHREYTEKAGLRVAGVWAPGDDISESVLELEVA